MAGKKTFINPLTRSSESELNVPDPSSGLNVAAIEDSAASDKQKRTKGRDKVFEETHQRFTAWVDRELKRQFDDLAVQKKVSKTALLDEAIAVLLHKQERKPYTRQAKAE
jgi:hypothetical protein